MEDLISKRELLERYGVSYGALYRWKRMGLIPEDWFLRRATPTGQETFFHRAQICPRVEQILVEGIQIFAGVRAIQELAMIPYPQYPEYYNLTEVFPISPQAL